MIREEVHRAAAEVGLKATPGPWVASNNHSAGGWRVETDAEGYPNDGWCITSHMDGPDAEANARLIAAAPDLYAALEAVVAIADRKTVEFDAARDALARARGETA